MPKTTANGDTDLTFVVTKYASKGTSIVAFDTYNVHEQDDTPTTVPTTPYTGSTTTKATPTTTGGTLPTTTTPASATAGAGGLFTSQLVVISATVAYWLFK